jgi:anti-sigma regulatory factor (Ser/Thr protein kinase)
MSKNKITLSVPAKLKYTVTVEDFTDIILPHVKARDEALLSQQLRSILNEAFVNVIRHTPPNSDEYVQIIFDIDIPRLIIQFPDQGSGIQIEGYFPPYPPGLVGKTFSLFSTMDGEVYGTVDNEDSILLSFQECDLDKLDLETLRNRAKEGGMGLSLMIKLMDSVRFIYQKGKGNCLEVVKNVR